LFRLRCSLGCDGLQLQLPDKSGRRRAQAVHVAARSQGRHHMRFWRFAKWWLLAQVDDYPDFGLYRTLIRQESFDRTQIDALRRDTAKRLVATCTAHVPYYGRLLREAGLEADAIRDPRDLERLPILDKGIIRIHQHEMLNTAAPAGTYFAHTTG